MTIKIVELLYLSIIIYLGYPFPLSATLITMLPTVSVQQTHLLMAAFFAVYNYVFICTPAGFLKQPVIWLYEEMIALTEPYNWNYRTNGIYFKIYFFRLEAIQNVVEIFLVYP